MREHCVICRIEGDKPINKIQTVVNYFAAAYVESALKRSGLSKEEQIAVLSEMIRNYKSKETGEEQINSAR